MRALSGVLGGKEQLSNYLSTQNKPWEPSPESLGTVADKQILPKQEPIKNTSLPDMEN